MKLAIFSVRRVKIVTGVKRVNAFQVVEKVMKSVYGKGLNLYLVNSVQEGLNWKLSPVQAPHEIVSLFSGSRQVVYGFVPHCKQVQTYICMYAPWVCV